jgi:ubiquinone/menaquinone biosynthesis C-methylase UbiE
LSLSKWGSTFAGMDAAQVKQFFEDVASEWDSMRLAWYDERVIEELAQRAHVKRSSTVLDVGTGTGFVAAGLAPRVARVVAVDNSPAMLEVANSNIRKLELVNVELRDADIAHLPLPANSVDAAVANMVLHHAEDPAAVLHEMVRVTKRGGWVAVTDEVEHPYEWMRTEHADVWLGFREDQVAGFFDAARVQHYGYAPLGMQCGIKSTTSVDVAEIEIFSAWGQVAFS